MRGSAWEFAGCDRTMGLGSSLLLTLKGKNWNKETRNTGGLEKAKGSALDTRQVGHFKC